MKEFIQKNCDEVAIVVYDAPLPPKYFKVTKRFIKSLFIVVPVIFILLLSALFAWGLGTRLKEVPAPSLPSVLTETDSKVISLEVELNNLKESNQVMADKLANQESSSSTPDEQFLMLVKKPYGMQNLVAEKRVSLDQLEVAKDSNRVGLNFSIISSNPETKVTGHVLVFMVSENGVLAYPKDANASVLSGIKYSAGEPFSVSRLRPTKAEFDVRSPGDSANFIIYIFSREGDLLLVQETEPFKLGAK